MNLITKTALVLVLTNGIFGCTTEKNHAESSKTQEKSASEPIGKPSAPITMNYEISKSNLQPNEEFSIQLKFSSDAKSEISVTTASNENLILIKGEQSWKSGLLKPGVTAPLPSLSFMATENGTFYVRLLASINFEGKIMAKPFIIPVIIGDGKIKLESVGEIVTDEKGQTVIFQKGESTN